MRQLNKTLMVVLTVMISTMAIGCSDEEIAPEKVMTPSELLSSTAWETTNAKDNEGQDVDLSDPNVSNFVGYAYFKADGTFTMFNLDDSPKMKGDWTVSADGKTRTIIAKNDQGETLFTRVVDITVLTKEEFTYRVYNGEDKTIYFDIVHTPTDHQEPK